MPGTLPVVNQTAVEYAIRVALALECKVQRTSIFARKNYFYPDLPKGYQISQYESPLAVNGQLAIHTAEGEKVIRVRRVHLEEDTGKLTHVEPRRADRISLVDLNRAGVPLLEIVSEPDLHSAEEARAYGEALRAHPALSGGQQRRHGERRDALRSQYLGAAQDGRAASSAAGDAHRGQEPEFFPRHGTRHRL